MKVWNKDDVIQEQRGAGAEDDLHFVVQGHVALHRQESKGNMAMYKVLKGRSFAKLSSFGPMHEQRGPGEAFGEGSLQLRPGPSHTVICESEQAMTLRVERRECEQIVEHWRRRERDIPHKTLRPMLAKSVEERSRTDVKALSAFLLLSTSPFHGVSDAGG